jgi:hypothetical protein
MARRTTVEMDPRDDDADEGEEGDGVQMHHRRLK